jgi:hypothetical protein
MYIPAAPLCDKNVAYADKVARAFRDGRSPDDFPREDYEAQWDNRFRESELNTHGRRSLGLDPSPTQ